MDNGHNYIELPRGGYLVDTSIGPIQIGAPPETIKDTMRRPGGVPRVFVLTDTMFDWNKGISLGEIEFPLYYNFFIKKQKTLIICQKHQYARIMGVLQESLFGPKDLDIMIDFDPVCTDCHIPDIRSEMKHFRNNLRFSDLMSIGLFKKNRFTHRGITFEKNKESFIISDKSGVPARVPARIEYTPTYQIGERLPEPYRPRLFSVTCLGPSHGFDPDENTSGYIIWLNHNGIMVDPPVNSTEWLEDSNVNPKLIDSIILTHCHADHDAGTFQKILEEEKITLYATENVLMSFLRKYSALSDVPVDYLMKLFHFHPVKIGRPVFIHGGRFDMFYTLHSIPTIGFKMEFQDQTFVYSSDHNNDPEVHKKLLDTGVISRERYDQLRNFPWDSKVIYHESGIPPLHTPIAYLNSLPEDIKKRTVIYHIAKKDFPAETSLTLATFGIEHTLDFPTATPSYEKPYQIINVLKNLEVFRDLPMEKVQEFITIVEEEHFTKGALIIKKDTPGDKFYIIYSGNVSVAGDDLEQRKIYGTYEFFGEVALVTEGMRAADVYAETDVVAFTIVRDKFLNFITGTEYEQTLKRLAKIRNSETWNLLSTSRFFRRCTSSQKTWLESMFVPMEKKKSGILIKEGKEFDYIYIIREGEVEVSRKGKSVARLHRGDFIGSMQKIYRGEPAGFSFANKTRLSFYAIKSENIRDFAEKNPGLLMQFIDEY